MSGPFFTPEQQAAIRAALPAGVDAEKAQCAMNACEELATHVALGEMRKIPDSGWRKPWREFNLEKWTKQWNARGGIPPTPEELANWRINMPDAEWMTRLDAASRTISRKEMRDWWKDVIETGRAHAQAILRVRPLQTALDADWHIPRLRELRETYERAALHVEVLDGLLKESSGQKNSLREIVYHRLLHIWTDVGGNLGSGYDRRQHKATGPAIRFLGLLVSLIFDEPVPPGDTLRSIIVRERKYRDEARVQMENYRLSRKPKEEK
jgi:hypothetical protein